MINYKTERVRAMADTKLINITLDGITTQTENDKRICDVVAELGLDGKTLNTMPLAAMIGGRVYDLSYRLRYDCDIRLLRYGCDAGRRIYERSLKFVLICAIKALNPKADVVEKYSLGKGVYIKVDNFSEGADLLTEQDADNIERKCREIVSADITFKRKHLDIKDAVKYYTDNAQTDKCELLRWRKFDYFDVYTLDGYDNTDYYYGQMLPSTGYLKVFDLKLSDGALIMLMPSQQNPSVAETYVETEKLSSVFSQTDEWCRLMGCSTVADLNRHVNEGSVRELIRLNETLHERMYAKAADAIAERGARAIMVAGPSSSGKTTSANRIRTHLRVLGLDPISLSLDNYYIDRDKIKPDENGEIDLEHINTLDTDRFSSDLLRLVNGESVEIPVFNFTTGKREKQGIIVKAGKNRPLIIEGIHGLNPLMLTDAIEEKQVYRIYVSALTTLNLDNHNRIRTSDVRLIRRLVRDYATRAASMEHTLSMWDSVRRGEEKWIFPYQEQADIIINTTLVYELAIMKKYVYNLLKDVPSESAYYTQAREIVKFLNYFEEADVDVEDEIPPTSVMREFIGGNTFYTD